MKHALPFILLTSLVPGCLTLRGDHDALAGRVDQLESGQQAQSEALQQSLKEAQELAASLETKLEEAEALLRRNQADLGLRVEMMELQLTQLEGLVENAEYVASASTQELGELRGNLDQRLKALEQKLNEATNIPEDKEGLFAEAERRQKRKDHAQARRLWRIYVSRYPGDAKLAEVRFNIGLTYFSERDYKSALGEFYRVIQETPGATVIPDALYYSGLAFAKIGQCQSAIAYFQALQKDGAKAPDRYRSAAAKQIQILQADKGELCADRGDASAGAAASVGTAKTAK